MVIRRAKQEDKEALWHTQTQAIRRMGTSHYSPEQIEAWAGGSEPSESHTQSIEHGTIFVAENADGKVMGFANLHMETGEVSAVYVHPDYARRGIGKQLSNALEEEARRLGIATLHVKASLNAVKFYERVGFKYEHEELHRFSSGIEIPCAVMTKVLSSHESPKPA